MDSFFSELNFAVKKEKMKLLEKKNYGRTAGFLYLSIAIIGGVSIGYIPGQIMVDGDISLTFQNLESHQDLFRWGIAGDVAVLVLETVLTVMLYRLFKGVSATGVMLATFSRAAMAIIMGVNLINHAVPLLISNHPELFSSFAGEQLELISFLFLRGHKYGELAWQLFFAVHLLSLGYVIRKSKLGHHCLGILMMVGSLGYAGDSFIRLIQIDSNVWPMVFSILLVLAVIAELWFTFWLLIRGMEQKP